ncbi:MAG: lipase [Caldilineaceae bacterium]|nr:lipase [Caldilineaceae bacterium]
MSQFASQPTSTAAGTVVLVPGWLDTEETLRPLAQALDGRSWRTIVISPQPSDGTVSLEALAEQVDSRLQAILEPDAPFMFVGFSMGGLIGRIYLQSMNGYRRIQRFVTIATPHRGTLAAYLFDRPAMREMRPGSTFLSRLNGDLSRLAAVPFVSIWSALDLTIIPATNSILPVGMSWHILSPAHAFMPFDPRVHRAVARAVGQVSPLV